MVQLWSVEVLVPLGAGSSTCCLQSLRCDISVREPIRLGTAIVFFVLLPQCDSPGYYSFFVQLLERVLILSRHSETGPCGEGILEEKIEGGKTEAYLLLKGHEDNASPNPAYQCCGS